MAILVSSTGIDSFVVLIAHSLLYSCNDTNLTIDFCALLSKIVFFKGESDGMGASGPGFD